jgi:hypothetical protein
MSRRAFVTLAQAVYTPDGTLATGGGRHDARRPRC